jgi:hypothetical protein
VRRTAPHLRPIAAAAWRFRFTVEREAEVRFASLAERLSRLGAARTLVDLARRSSRDEGRHAALCALEAERCGTATADLPEPVLRRIAPRRLSPRERLLYEVVAACCITETESMGVLSTLLGCAHGARLRRVLRELAADEVRHARLGWAWLAAEQARGATSFLGPLVPGMLEGSVGPDLFSPASPDEDDEALLEHGVLPHALKRAVFTRTLEDVILPGLSAAAVDVAPARAWLERQRIALAAARAARGGSPPLLRPAAE